MLRIDTPALALFSLACGVLLGACATPIGYASGTSVTERDSLHRSTAAPAVDMEAPFIAHTVETDIAVPPDRLLPWLVNVPLERILLGTEKLAGIERTDVLSPAWGSPGARRRVVLRDGNTSLEELLLVEEGQRFRYVVWNFTNEARRAVSTRSASSTSRQPRQGHTCAGRTASLAMGGPPRASSRTSSRRTSLGT